MEGGVHEGDVVHSSPNGLKYKLSEGWAKSGKQILNNPVFLL